MTQPEPTSAPEETDVWSTEGPAAGLCWLDVTLAELPAKPALVVAPSTEVKQVIALMNEHDQSAVLVMDQGAVLGIFTERDVVRRAMPLADGLHRKVGELMTSRPYLLTESTSFATALGKLTRGGFHHLPVLNAVGYPAKIVSLHDIVGYLVETFSNEILHDGLEQDSGRARASGQWPALPEPNQVEDDDGK